MVTSKTDILKMIVSGECQLSWKDSLVLWFCKFGTSLEVPNFSRVWAVYNFWSELCTDYVVLYSEDSSTVFIVFTL